MYNRLNESTVKECTDDIDLIIALESEDLIVEDFDDWNRIKALAADFAQSQGSYGRLLRDMREYERSFGGAQYIEFPIVI